MPQALAELARWYAEGKIKPVIDQQLPMAELQARLRAHGQPPGARQAGDGQPLRRALVRARAMSAIDALERNKQAVVAFYDLMFNQCRPAEAIERYAGDELHPAQPARRRRQGGVHRLLRADGARVPGQARRLQAGDRRGRPTSSCTATRTGPATDDWAGIDIFRLDEDGKIVEHWDVLQVVPASRPTATPCSEPSCSLAARRR